jgi:hypothetical protein
MSNTHQFLVLLTKCCTVSLFRNTVARVLAAGCASLDSGDVMMWHDHAPESVSHIVGSELAATNQTIGIVLYIATLCAVLL